MALALNVSAIFLGAYLLVMGNIRLSPTLRLVGWRIRLAGLLLMGSVPFSLGLLLLTAQLAESQVFCLASAPLGRMMMPGQALFVAASFVGVHILMADAPTQPNRYPKRPVFASNSHQRKRIEHGGRGS